MDYLRLGHSDEITDPRERRVYRRLEILPGLLAWGTLLAVIVLSFLTPTFIAVFIILFDIYWLVKTLFLSLHLRASFSKMRANLKVNWRQRLEALAHWQDIYHLVILPMAAEPLAVVKHSFRGLAQANYPLDKLIVVLATEARAGAPARAIADSIQREYGRRFQRFLVTVHPDGLSGEIAGKGSNEAWAGRQAQRLIDELAILYRNVIVSVFDIDTVAPPDFFACLTWHYLTADKPLRSSYQPVPLFINNIWQAPAFARVFAFATTFWQMIQQARPEQLVTFSSQSISLQAVVEVGFWQENVVSEDSRIFWQCLLRYDGDWRTVPLHYPVYMDANVAPTFWQTVKNQYKQIRRWHFGVENNPYFMFGFRHHPRIPRRTKWYFNWQMAEKAHSSSTNALIIFLLGWLPLVAGGAEFNRTVLSFNLPRVTRDLMVLSMFGLITSAILAMALLPPRPPEYGRYKWLWMFLQWLLFPVNFIVFGAIPALDAQTHLLFKKYLGFWVTPKQR